MLVTLQAIFTIVLTLTTTSTSSATTQQLQHQTPCPPPCLCTWVAGGSKEGGSYDVDCSLQGLTRVVAVHRGVIENSLVRLNLHSNHISILKSHSFSAYSPSNTNFSSLYNFYNQNPPSNDSNHGHYHNGKHHTDTHRHNNSRPSGLTHLNLASNGMLHLERNSFDPLTTLKSLTLSNNHLSYLDKDIFIHLYNLQHLDLSSNYLYDTTNTHLAFHHLFNLQHLDLSLNNFDSLPLGTGLERCSKLTVIDFSGRYKYILKDFHAICNFIYRIFSTFYFLNLIQELFKNKKN